jgi:hypothetical protein
MTQYDRSVDFLYLFSISGSISADTKILNFKGAQELIPPAYVACGTTTLFLLGS